MANREKIRRRFVAATPASPLGFSMEKGNAGFAATIPFCAFAFVCLIYAASLQADAPATQSATTNFTSKADGFSLDYPADWKKAKLKPGATVKVLVHPTNDKSIKIFINISPCDLPPGKIKAVTDVTLSMAKTVSDQEIKMDGAPAREIEFTTDDAETLEAACIKDGKMYVIVYAAPADDFPKYKDAAEAIIKSFKWAAADK